MDHDGRGELFAFLQRHFPQALPLSRYQPFDHPAVVSFELGADLAARPEEVLDVLADRAAQIYERVFAPEDRGWVCVVLRGALQAVLPEPLTIDDVSSDGRIDLDAFVPQPVRLPDRDGLAVPVDALPAAARDGLSVAHGSDPIDDPELIELYQADSLPYVDVVVRVRPREVDYRSLIGAVVNQDFPQEGRPRLIATLIVVNEDRLALFDMPDDRYCGVARLEAEALQDVYECGLAPLNDYRRSEMEAVFGFWPVPPGPETQRRSLFSRRFRRR